MCMTKIHKHFTMIGLRISPYWVWLNRNLMSYLLRQSLWPHDLSGTRRPPNDLTMVQEGASTTITLFMPVNIFSSRSPENSGLLVTRIFYILNRCHVSKTNSNNKTIFIMTFLITMIMIFNYSISIIMKIMVMIIIAIMMIKQYK